MSRMTPARWMTRWPLRYTAPLLLLLFAAVGGAGVFNYERQLEHARIRHDGLEQLRGFASMQAQNLREALIRGDLAGMRAQVAALALDPTIVRADLLGTNDAVLASTSLAAIGTVRRGETGVPGVVAPAVGLRLVRVAVPLRASSLGSGADPGRLVIDRDLSPRLLASEQRLQQAFVRYLLYFVGVSLLAWFWVERVVWRRLRGLGSKAERLAGGEYTLRFDEQGGDEIAAAARIANRAAAQLEHSATTNRRLTRALERLASASPGAGLYDELAGAVADGLGCRWAVIARRGATDDEMVVVGAAGGEPWQRDMTVSLAGAPYEVCVETPDQVFVIERDVHIRYPDVGRLHALPVESMLGLAIPAPSTGWSGLLCGIDPCPRRDDPADRALLRTAAHRIAQEFARADADARRREREQRLTLALDISNAVLTEWDIVRDENLIPPAWEQRFSLLTDNGRITQASWTASVHPDDREAFASVIGQALDDGSVAALDYRLPQRDGSWRWVRGRGTVSERDAAGRPVRFIALHADVHDLRESQARLQTSEARLQLALRAGALSIADWNVVTDELVMNPWWPLGLGYGANEVGQLRADWAALTHADDVSAVQAYLQALMREKGVDTAVEFRLRRRDGTWRWNRLQAMVSSRDTQGRATRMVGVFADIDAAKRADDALRERTEFLELAVRGTADGLFDWNAQRDDLYLSPRAHELLGYPAGTLSGTLTDLAARMLLAADEALVTQQAAKVHAGEDYVDFDMRVRCASGALRWFRVRGAARRVVGSVSDIHAQREREAELAQARQLTSEAIESLDAGLLRLDADERIVLLNSRYLALYGLPPERHYVGMTLREIVDLHYRLHPASLEGQDLAQAVEHRMRLFHEHTGRSEFRLGERWILNSDTPTADGGRVCLRTDVTSLKALQQRLKDRTDYLELVVRGTADGLWSWNAEAGDEGYLSPRFHELLGYAPGNLPTQVGAFERAIYHPEDRRRMREEIARLLANPDEGDILSIEVRCLCGDGVYRWFHSRAALVRDADGAHRAFVGSISNVHERRLREQEAEAARQRLNDAIEAIDSGLMMADRDDRLVLCNRRYREMYGFTPALARPGTHMAELARDLMTRHPAYRKGLPLEEAVAARVAAQRERRGRWELELGEHWYQIGDYATTDGGVVSLRTDITPLKRIEQQLRERTEFLEAAVRGSMDGLFDIDLARDAVYFAPRFHALLGYADGTLPTCWSEFAGRHFHPDEAPQRAATLRSIEDDHLELTSRELRVRRKDGRWWWFHGRWAVMRDEAGRACRLIGSISDTQQRHEREEELAEARQQLQDAVESLDAGIVMFDRDEHFVLCNQRFRAFYGDTGLPLVPGVKLEDSLRAHFTAYPAHCAGRPLDEVVAERIERYRNRRGRFEVRRGERWYQIENYSTADGGVVSLRSDITAMKRTEQALRESEARLRTVFDNSPFGIFLAGTDGAVVFRNRVFTALTGAGEREGRKYAWLGHVHEDERAWIGARWYEYVAAGAGAFDIEYRTAGAVAHIVRLRAAPIVEHGQALGFAGTLEDITAQRQAELEQHRLQMQLQQAQKMDAIGHLTGGIAHDFNNTLASILGYASLAGERRAVRDDVKLVTYLEAIRQSGERARELVAKMLAFSRSEPREVVTPTAIQPLVAEAVKLLKAIIPSSIPIVTVSEDALPAVLVDGVDLHQAIVNLAVNARDAMSGQGQITIAVRAPRQVKGQCASCREDFLERYVEIAVSDTGAGIAPEHLSRMFEPFFSTKEVGKGTGMGLAVTHGVIHRVGGHVLVESELGVGTTVRLMLRAAEARMRAVPGATASRVPTARRAATVLIVDDEPLVMGLISEVLEEQGYEVVCYTDARQALAWARSPASSFDLLVTDQTMAGLTGVELARELLALRPSLPIVLCTGFSESVDARVAAAIGIRHFFSKPIPLDAFVVAVDALLTDGASAAVVA